MDINFELYKVFYLAASHESFSAAASFVHFAIGGEPVD